MDTIMSEPAARQVQVQFFTNSPDIALPEEKQQLLVPTSKFNRQYRHSGWIIDLIAHFLRPLTIRQILEDLGFPKFWILSLC